jgi:transposase-like protein
MTCVTVRCLYCDSEQVVKRGKTGRGKQRYLCQSTSCRMVEILRRVKRPRDESS